MGISFVPFQDSSSMEPKLSGSCSKSYQQINSSLAPVPLLSYLPLEVDSQINKNIEWAAAVDFFHWYCLIVLPPHFISLLTVSSYAFQPLSALFKIVLNPLREVWACYRKKENKYRALLQIQCFHVARVSQFYLHFVLQKSKAGKGLYIFNVNLQCNELEEAENTSEVLRMEVQVTLSGNHFPWSCLPDSVKSIYLWCFSKCQYLTQILQQLSVQGEY